MATRKSFIKVEKEEPDFILSTPDNETIIGLPNDAYSHNGTVSDKMFNAVIKEEPVYDDIINCDDEEYLIEDSETDQTQESSTTKSTESKKRRTKINPAQFQKLSAYMRCNAADFNRDNRRLDQATKPFRIDDIWETITSELNAIGPPFRTNAQWRRAWTVYKSNKRRRETGNKETDDGENKRMRFESRLSSDGLDAMSLNDYVHATATKDNITNSKTNGERLNAYHFHSEMLKKMDLICQQQIQQTNQLEKLNRNLEKLIEVVAEKFP